MLFAPSVYAADSKRDFFESQVRPLLVDRCVGCHGPEKQKGELRLDHLDFAKRGGESGPALVPGDPEMSRMVKGIRYEDVNFQMPPKKKLSSNEILILEQWIAEGAFWPEEPLPGGGQKEAEAFPLLARKESQWAFQPVLATPPPRTQNREWVQNPVDAFILNKLEKAGIQPNPPADRHVLIRRAYFDLLGLPPTPEQVRAFVNNPDENAFEKLVDELLLSSHFGERWARKWMDLVRYAETLGHEFDYVIPNAWRYRDYLIRAFNADVPYDQFVLEHVAGDTLENPRRNPEKGFNESAIATGFYWFTQQTHSPVDIRQYQADMVDNQIDVFSKTFLGLTVACARCHDHKFDPITTKDFYSLYGTLTSSRYHQIELTEPKAWDAAREKKTKWISQFKSAQADAWKNQLGAFQNDLVAQLTQDNEKTDTGEIESKEEAEDSNNYINAWRPIFQESQETTDPKVTAASQLQTWTNRPELSIEHWDNRGQAWDLQPELIQSDRWTPESGWEFSLSAGPKSGLESDRLQGALRSPTFEIKEKFIHIRVRGKGTRINLVVDNFNIIRDPIYGDLKKNINMVEPGWVRMNTAMWVGRSAYLEFIDMEVGDLSTGAYPNQAYLNVESLQFSDSPSAPDWQGLSVASAWKVLFPNEVGAVECASDITQRAELLADNLKETLEAWGAGASSAGDWSAEEILARKTLLSAAAKSPALQMAPEWSEPWIAGWKDLESQIPSPIYAPGMIEGDPISERVYIRGNPKNYGEVAHRNFLEAFLEQNEREAATSPFTGSGRREWADFLTDPRNPLTSRVMVNRIWAHLFGQGISPSVDNFGELGREPTHPELLDFLAQWYVTNEWSNKSLMRMLMTSSAYQMSSHPSDSRTEEMDPSNDLLHRFRLRRMDGEAIRDKILTLSGRLDRSVAGPSIPIYLTPFMDGRGRPGKSGPLDGDGRRSVYVEVRRNFLSPMMLAFDTPQPSSTVGQRSVSNVPAQALILMNDPFVHEEADLWAKRLLENDFNSVPKLIDRAFEMAFGREAESFETKIITDFLSQGQATESPVSEAAVSDFLHSLITSKEFIFIP